VREVHDALSLPLYARPHSLVAFTSEKVRPDADWTKTLTVKAFALNEGTPARTVLVDTKGRSLGAVTVTRRGRALAVTAPVAVLPFTLVVDGQSHTVTKETQNL